MTNPTETSRKPRVLFICSANSARSQLAQALLEWRAGDRYEVTSAGLSPGELHPLTVRVLREKGLPTEHLHPKALSPLLREHFAHVVTVCARAERNCPIFPHASFSHSWPFPDPAQTQGSEAERLAAFRVARDAIDERVRAWLDERGARGGRDSE